MKPPCFPLSPEGAPPSPFPDLCKKSNDNRASVPLEDATLALSQPEEDADIVLWRQLYRDPFYELRLLSLKPIESENAFGEEPGDILQSRVASFTPTLELEAKLQEAGIAEIFAEAREAVIRSELYQRALLFKSWVCLTLGIY